MSTRTKSRPQHRETPTQALRRQLNEAEARAAQQPGAAELADLRADNARLDATVQALAAQLATVSEHRFPVDGANHILAKLHADSGQWAVLDDTLLAARFWGLDHTWHSTSGACAAAMFPWSESDACRLGRLLAGRALLAAEVLPPVAVDEPEPGFVCGPVLPLSQLADAPQGTPAEDAAMESALADLAAADADVRDAAQALAQAKAELLAEAAVNRLLSGEPLTLNQQMTAAADLDQAIADGGQAIATHALDMVRSAWEATRNRVPAPADLPDYVPEPADAPEPDRVHNLIAQGIPVNTEQETVALPQVRVHGPDQTQVLPVVPLPADAPPMPPAPPPVPLLGLPLGPLPLPPITWGVGPAAGFGHSRSIPVRLATT